MPHGSPWVAKTMRPTLHTTCALVAVSACALVIAGCLPPKCKCTIGWTSDAGTSLDKVEYRCRDNPVTFEFEAVVIPQLGEWREVIEVRIDNLGVDSALYDWSTAAVTLSDSIRVRPREALSSAGRFIRGPVRLAPGKKVTLGVIFEESEYLALYERSPYLKYDMGTAHSVNAPICTIPSLFVFTNYCPRCPR